QGEPEAKSRSFAFSFANRLDGATVQLHKLLDYGESQTQPTIPAGRRGVGLSKRFKHVREKSRGNPVASIHYGDLHVMGTRQLQSKLYLPFFRRELDRLGKEIPDHLLQPIRISPDRDCRSGYDAL